MASLAKQSLWLALLLFVMGVVMDNKSISPSEVAIYAVLALVLFMLIWAYRSEYASLASNDR